MKKKEPKLMIGRRIELEADELETYDAVKDAARRQGTTLKAVTVELWRQWLKKHGDKK